jgi:hypothetical protein
MKKEYLILGGLVLVGFYLYSKKGKQTETEVLASDSETPETVERIPFKEGATEGSGTNIGFDCAKYQSENPTEYSSTYRFVTSSNRVKSLSLSEQKQAVCNYLRFNRNNRITIGNCLTGPC